MADGEIVLPGNATNSPFGFHEEEAIIPFALDFPEIFTPMIEFIDHNFFSRAECQFVMAWILKLHSEYQVIPTRNLLYDKISRSLTTDDPYKDILGLVTRESNPREVPIIRGALKKWAESRQFGMLYSDDAIAAYHQGDYNKLRTIFDGASKISNSGSKCFWFFDQFEELLNPELEVRYGTGFPRLDKNLNDGGPGPGEVIIWMAATNVGKSIWLCNMSVNSVMRGLDTLHITCEMSARRTARRILGAMTQRRIKNFRDEQSIIRDTVVRTYNTHQAKLAILEFNQEECSVDHISAHIEEFKRTKGWAPKVIVIDYLELMLSRRDDYNRDDYGRQKHVSAEICGLSKTHHVLVHSATQTNRSGSGSQNRPGGESSGSRVIELNQAAESYGKMMPADYVISLNQTNEERTAEVPIVRMFIAKNREGPRSVTIDCRVNYETMKVIEEPA